MPICCALLRMLSREGHASLVRPAPRLSPLNVMVMYSYSESPDTRFPVVTAGVKSAMEGMTCVGMGCPNASSSLRAPSLKATKHFVQFADGAG